MDDIDERLSRATELAAAGEFSRALELIEPLSTTAPTARVLGVLAGILMRCGRVAEARDYFRETTRISPASELASVGLFHCLWDLGEHEAAKVEVARFLSARPSAEYEQLLGEMGWEFDQVNGHVIDRR